MSSLSSTINSTIRRVFPTEYATNDSIDWFLFVRVSLMVIGYFVATRLYDVLFVLPFSYYQKPSLVLGLLQQPTTLILIPFIGLVFYFRERAFAPWSALDKGHSIRWIMMMAVVTLVWPYATYNYNFLLDQSHLSDRLLLIILGVLVWYRPIFIYPFIFLTYLIIGQTTLLPGFSWAIPKLPIHLLTIFGVYFLFHIVFKYQYIKEFVFVLLCLMMSHYWNSGWSKVTMTWIFGDHLNYLLPATYANGWLGHIPSADIARWAEQIEFLNPVLRIMVVVAEVGCVFALFHRRLSLAFLVGFSCFHIGVFFYSGICFWVWVLLEIVIIYLLFSKKHFAEAFPYRWPYLVLSVFLILSSRYWVDPARLSWHNNPMTYTYIFEAHTSDGATTHLPPHFFAPYEFNFTTGGFKYLNPNPVLQITWGASNAQTVNWFKTEPSKDDIFAYEKENGKIRYNEKQSLIFEAFLKRFVNNWNQQQQERNNYYRLAAPRYFWTFPSAVYLPEESIIDSVTVFETSTLYRNGTYSEIRKRPLRTITIE